MWLALAGCASGAPASAGPDAGALPPRPMLPPIDQGMDASMPKPPPPPLVIDAGLDEDGGEPVDAAPAKPTACENGKKDGFETGTDCGGADCAPCALGQGCVLDGDCVMGVCEQGVCACNVDTDGDGTDDCDEACPEDPLRTELGDCGCGGEPDPAPANTPCDDGACAAANECDGLGHCGKESDCYVPGLREGSLASYFDVTTANPGNLGVSALGPTRTETTGWPAATTYVMTGEVFVGPSGVISFFENIDDAIRLVVDGQMVLEDMASTTPSAGTLTRPSGWYAFELRVSNNGGPGGQTGTLGFGYATTNTVGSTSPASYTAPVNSAAGTADLFRTPPP